MPQYPLNQPVSFNYAHIASATTTVVKSLPGLLDSIVVNSASDGTITIYDGLSTAGAVVGVITISAPVTVPLIWPNSTNGMSFKTGLTIVTSATCDLTVLYR